MRVARALRGAGWPASEEARQRLQWLCDQDVLCAVSAVSATAGASGAGSAGSATAGATTTGRASTATTAGTTNTEKVKAGAAKKKKKKAKAVVTPVVKEEVKEEAKEEESGFTVVKKGAVVGTVLERSRPSPMAHLFEDSTVEEDDVQVAIAMAAEDDLAWEGLSNIAMTNP